MYLFAIGFLMGCFVIGCSLFSMVARWKWENIKLISAAEAAWKKALQSDERAAIVSKHLIDANDEIEQLRKDKLDRWGIPDKL